jgi:Short C-terminal domain
MSFVARDATGAVSPLDPDTAVASAGDELAMFAGAASGLLDAGVLTDAEFEAQKALLLHR